MAIDPNISLQAGVGVPQLDVLGTMGKVQSLQNAQLQNKLGTVELGTKEQALAVAQKTALGRVAIGALSRYNPEKPEAFVHDLHNAIEYARNTGAFNTTTAQALIDGIAKQDMPSLLAQTKQYATFALEPNTALDWIYGKPGMVDTGATKQYGTIGNAMFRPGFTASGSGITNQMSPDSQAALVEVPVMKILPDGTKVATDAREMVSRAEAARRGNLEYLLPSAELQANNAAFPRNFTGRPAPVAPAPAVAAPPQIQAPARTTYGESQGPQVATTTVANATAGSAMGNTLIQQADTVPNQRAIIGEMEAALDKFTTGKGQQAKLNMQGYVQSMAPGIARAFNIDPKAIASAETFNKLAQQIMLLQGSSLGLGTDASRAALFGGNPNMDLSKLGNSTILKIMHGNADSVEAKAAAWRQSPEYRTGDYSGFSIKFNKGFDPRVYQWAHLDSTERAAMLAGSGKGRDDLIEKIRASMAR